MYSNLTLDASRRWLALTAGLLALGTISSAASAETAGASTDSYTWSAELVSLDESAGTAVVKSRVVEHAEIDNLSDLDEGDRVTIVWSGLTWASGIRSIETGSVENERFALPAEFVSSEMDGQYVTFRVRIPSEDLPEIRSLSEGEWVTLTSPHQPSGWEEAVADARPYSDAA